MYQIFKLLGSSEVLGDPIGLCQKLGKCFKDLFSEPASCKRSSKLLRKDSSSKFTGALLRITK